MSECEREVVLLKEEVANLKQLLSSVAGVLAEYTGEEADVVKELRKAAEITPERKACFSKRPGND